MAQTTERVMTTDKTLKRRVRARMTETGERYAAAHSQVVRKRDRVSAAAERLAAPDDRPSDAAIEAATGQGWEAWFGELDAWGGREHTHPATAAHLTGERGVPGWWAQSITVYYQRSRGLRLKHQQAHGFTVSASKTIASPIRTAFEAFTDDARRGAWLSDGTATLRTSRPDHAVAWTARFDWDGGPSRLLVTFEDKGPSKVTVTVSHERIPDADEAESAKSAWRRRLVALKAYLEG